MSRLFLSALRDLLFGPLGDAGEEHGPGRFEIGGRSLECSHCGGTEFMLAITSWHHHLALPVDLPWLDTDRRPSKLLCTHCTQVLTFARKPTRTPEP